MTELAVGDRVLRDLRQPDAHPHDPGDTRDVDWVQTHLSHVLLTGSRVYKFRKPVDLGFVRFRSRAERNADCENEIALNRRLAPDVYLGVAPLVVDRGRFSIGPVAAHVPSGDDPPECCVVMRRLPTGRDALSLLGRDALPASALDRVAARMVAFHAETTLGRPAPFSAHEWHARCLDPVEQSFRALGAAPERIASHTHLREALDAVRRFGERHAERFDRRRRAGRAVDGHGDLHLQHVWFEHDDDAPIVIDCVEFDERLRQIDAASEVAFLAMDLRYRGRNDLAERFLSVYASESDDFDLYSVVDFFVSYRAAVRAKVAAVAASDAGVGVDQRAAAEASTRGHVELARAAATERKTGSITLVGGAVGTGKSTVSRVLCDVMEGAIVASDRVRKHLAGLGATDRPTPGGEDPYTRTAIDGTYTAMLERARAVVESGRPVVLDATWAQRRHREAAFALAHELGVEARMIETRCAPDRAIERLTVREARGTDPSDAGPDLHLDSVERFEPVSGEGHLDVVHTDDDAWPDRVTALGRAMLRR